MNRRALLLSFAPLLLAGAARGEAGLRDSWIGTWRGSISFRRSLPLVDIYPPPAQPHVEIDDRTPIALEVVLSGHADRPTVLTRIGGGPMLTSPDGETLAFEIMPDGKARLMPGSPRSTPDKALLVTRPDALGTECLFRHADGSFWRRHINLRFAGDGERAEVILWVFDAEGTRARNWRGDVTRER